MAITMSEQSKNEMLDSIKEENETYEAKMWGTLMPSNKEIIVNSIKYSGLGPIGAGMAGATGAMSNQYCYIGMTKTGIYFVIIKTMKVNEIVDSFKLPYDAITKVKIKSSIIPGRRVVHIDANIGKLELSLMNNAIGSDIQGQKEAVQYFCDNIQTRLVQ